MELQQALNDTKKEAAENERALDHWRTQHDNLKLEEVEYVIPPSHQYVISLRFSVMKMKRRRANM